MKKEYFGTRSLLLLPQEKLKDLSPRGKPFRDELHEWLLDTFNGYTISSDNITGYWREQSGHEISGKYIEYRIACSKEEAIPDLVRRLSLLARELGEDCLFWENGGQAWLIYPE